MTTTPIQQQVRPEHKGTQPLYFSVDFIFIERMSFKLYATSSTNLSLVNLIPQM